MEFVEGYSSIVHTEGCKYFGADFGHHRWATEVEFDGPGIFVVGRIVIEQHPMNESGVPCRAIFGGRGRMGETKVPPVPAERRGG